jgi:hypothetical protein
MTTIGDVLAIVAVLAGICLSAWALILAVALVFPRKADQARSTLVHHPWASFFIGLILWATVGLFGFILTAQAFPPAKLLGWTIVMPLLSVASVGSAGLAGLAAQRLRHLAPDQTAYVNLSRSAAFIVLAGLVPLLGWFLIVPFLIFASTGAGVAALVTREDVSMEAPGCMP